MNRPVSNLIIAAVIVALTTALFVGFVQWDRNERQLAITRIAACARLNGHRRIVTESSVEYAMDDLQGKGAKWRTAARVLSAEAGCP